jgi:demethylmenaquinone methyltransferase/2-methoxy-6-polyprenyl-1,4-benzoquinol methylase
MSLNIDRMWRRRVVRIVKRSKPQRVMDIATGTGDLAIAMARSMRDLRIVGIDLSEEMLAVAARKVEKEDLSERIELHKGDAEQLDMVADGSMDMATVAFGVRNFENMERGLAEIYRTLKSDGRLIVLEFSIPRNRFVRWVYAQYSHRLLPRIGAMISKDKQAYTYLPESVEEFPSPERFSEILQSVGFRSVRRRSQSFGIAYIYEALK